MVRTKKYGRDPENVAVEVWGCGGRWQGGKRSSGSRWLMSAAHALWVRLRELTSVCDVHVACVCEEDAPGAAMRFGNAWASYATVRHQCSLESNGMYLKI